MRGIIASVVMLTILPCLVAADEWPAAKVQQIFNGNGLHFVRIVPGDGYGDTVGFKGSKTGAYARGEFYEKQSDRSYKLMADVALQNPVAPGHAAQQTRIHIDVRQLAQCGLWKSGCDLQAEWRTGLHV